MAYESYGADNAPGAEVIRELLHNRLGSVLLAITVSTGAVAGEYEYDSFGHRAATGIEQRYGFTGREHDAESGLIYLRARHYDATTGRFLQRDPIGFAGGDLNLYAYTWNDPHNWTDPSGLVVTADFATNTGRAAAATGLFGGLFLAVQNLANSVAAMIGETGPDDPDDLDDKGGDPPPRPNDDDGCEPGDLDCKKKPKECTDRIFGDVDFFGDRSSGDLSTIPWDTMGPNAAHRLAVLLEESILQRRMENINKGPDKGHNDRIDREIKARNKAREKSKGHKC